MSIKIKAGTCFVLAVEIDDSNFSAIDHIEFLFKQEEKGETLKSAYWSANGVSRDCQRQDNTQLILVAFSRADTYLFRQNEVFFMDTRIHYQDADTNPYTNIVRLFMRETLFAEGEEVTS